MQLRMAVARSKGLLDQLTVRELEVAKQLVKGASHKEIARDLALAPATVRNHIASIHAKLGSSKVAQLATLLLNEGGCEMTRVGWGRVWNKIFAQFNLLPSPPPYVARARVGGLFVAHG